MSHDWTGPAIAGTALAAVGVLVALGAWLLPRGPESATPTPLPPGTTTGGTGSTASPPTSSIQPGLPTAQPSAASTDVRYLSDLTPTSGAAGLAGSGPAGRHALVIPCASGASDDRSREIRWNTVSSYTGLTGSVSIGGKLDPQARVQLEWFTGGARAFNTSTLVHGSTQAFTAELTGPELTVRVTCQSRGGVVTILDAAVSR